MQQRKVRWLRTGLETGTSLVCFSGLLDTFMEGGIGAPAEHWQAWSETPSSMSAWAHIGKMET